MWNENFKAEEISVKIEAVKNVIIWNSLYASTYQVCGTLSRNSCLKKSDCGKKKLHTGPGDCSNSVCKTSVVHVYNLLISTDYLTHCLCYKWTNDKKLIVTSNCWCDLWNTTILRWQCKV